MLKQCNSSWTTAILDYIKEDYSKCLYTYINFQKYGFKNNNFKIWVSLNDQGGITALIARYYTGVHIYCRSDDYIVEDLVFFIRENSPSIVNSTGPIIKRIEVFFTDYTAHYGSVGQVKKIPCVSSKLIEEASLDDMYDIAKLLSEDDGLGRHYDILLLEHQLKERYNEGFGRNYIIKKRGVIVSHCATYAQTNQIGVTSGIFTVPNERGNGYAHQIYCKLCFDLLQEGKEVFAYYYTLQAHRLHEKVGFQVISSWAKLVKDQAFILGK
ncbi:hypothetical protein QPK24_21630 [Paenibacillus polygoni]|uniref:N-acetyltransferase domain-containing protein n=1 Tax=Paenibacillus polygoni TaxID=3050112 RepID=A0ABY8X3Q8_9BACL|nr:GNAT family N-acetyltransferase [Paenibacillus polygoni]WIV18893.1 hypothetical protein QPK24_21630 [Paenibacillus polygoni]